MVEWLGLLGVLPFFTLLFFVLLNIGKVYGWMARTGSAFHYSIPITMVMTAGLVHALFEDWLLAVGFYLTVFFWSLAFILDDLLPAGRRVSAYQPWVQPQPSLARTEPLPSVP